MSKRIITLGKWNDNPIDWIVLKEDDFCKLIITKDRIGDEMQFSNRNDNQWKNSDIRTFLNGEFWESAFTAEEKKKIINAYLETPNKTKDNIFLLDWNEAVELMEDDDWYYSNRYSNNEDYLSSSKRSCGWYYKRCWYCCWYRTPNGSSVQQGYPGHCSCGRGANNWYYFRPALYLKK